MKRIVFLIPLLLSITPALADFSGKLTRVLDGDTVEVTTPHNKTIRIRLVDIDAPEIGQSFGNRSKQLLLQIAGGDKVRVKDHGLDRYNRTLGTIYNIQCDERGCNEIDINAQMVISGMAWAYRYKGIPSDNLIAEYEREAKQHKRGLWIESNPIEPWKWRRDNK